MSHCVPGRKGGAFERELGAHVGGMLQGVGALLSRTWSCRPRGARITVPPRTSWGPQ